MSDGNLTLAKELMGYADWDTRRLREKLEDLERGDSVRLVTDSRDTLARVEKDTQVREDVDCTERILEAPVKVYADSPEGHFHTVISWLEPGPILLIVDGEERGERLDFK